MSPSALTRPLLRQSGTAASPWGRMAARRFESTASAANAKKATETAKDSASKASSAAKDSAAKVQATVSEYSAKAAQGLSRVTATAGPAITGAVKGVATSLSKAGGRTGKLVGFVEKQVPTVVFYSKVGAELAKLIFRGQNMSPPPLTTFQTYFQNIYKTYLQNPSALLETASKVAQQPSALLQQARSISRAQIIAGGVIAAECLGFFTVGEMIGRFKIIGYHGEGLAAHH